MARTKKKQSKKGLLDGNLEMFAFWTGFASTLISLVQVVIIASR